MKSLPRWKKCNISCISSCLLLLQSGDKEDNFSGVTSKSFSFCFYTHLHVYALLVVVLGVRVCGTVDYMWALDEITAIVCGSSNTLRIQGGTWMSSHSWCMPIYCHSYCMCMSHDCLAGVFGAVASYEAENHPQFSNLQWNATDPVSLKPFQCFLHLRLSLYVMPISKYTRLAQSVCKYVHQTHTVCL